MRFLHTSFPSCSRDRCSSAARLSRRRTRLKDREHILRALSNRMAEERQDDACRSRRSCTTTSRSCCSDSQIQVDVTRKNLDAGKLAEAEQQLAEIKETKNKTSTASAR